MLTFDTVAIKQITRTKNLPGNFTLPGRLLSAYISTICRESVYRDTIHMGDDSDRREGGWKGVGGIILRDTHQIADRQAVLQFPLEVFQRFFLLRFELLLLRIEQGLFEFVLRTPFVAVGFQVFDHTGVDLVETLRVVGVPDERTVELRLRDTMVVQYLLIVFRHRLVVPVVVARHLQDRLGVVQVV